MGNEFIITYCLTIFIASIIPGPSMLLALAKGSDNGWLAGCIAALGNVLVSTAQAIAALLVILELGRISDFALLIIKYLGAVYIIYMGISLTQVRSFGAQAGGTAITGGQHGWLLHLRQGFMFAIFNPKAILFFAALFPQFISGQKIGMQNLLLIFVPIWGIAFACFMLYAFAGVAIIKILGRPEHMGKVFGLLIIAAGVVLILT